MMTSFWNNDDHDKPFVLGVNFFLFQIVILIWSFLKCVQCDRMYCTVWRALHVQTHRREPNVQTDRINRNRLKTFPSQPTNEMSCLEMSSARYWKLDFNQQNAWHSFLRLSWPLMTSCTELCSVRKQQKRCLEFLSLVYFRLIAVWDRLTSHERIM